MHLIADNDCTHKHANVRGWLTQRPRFDVHDTPRNTSCLNQVECWFGVITKRAIRHGSFSRIKKLSAKIENCVTNDMRPWRRSSGRLKLIQS